MAFAPIKKILIANRGEIAVRIIRACREMEIATVAVYSEADRAAPHVGLADEAQLLGPPAPRESYLHVHRVLAAAEKTGADAIHPGYGFLAENARFARACEDRGLVFIGPRSETIALMGKKTTARRAAVAAGVPVVPGTLEAVADDEALAREAARIGFPLMLKAAAGGGGKGIRLVEHAAVLASAAAGARGEARTSFGDDGVYLEKALFGPRHIEIQVLADAHGNAVHLFERDCSIQRRHQKLIEESPSPFVSPGLRERMGDFALRLARHAGYVNAGTVEFLVDEDGAPYFLEMNTRLQVEHPVTEMVTGLDLVQLQIRIAQGEPIPFRQEDLVQRGHAIECRVYAEDPERGFLPSPGLIRALRVPSGPGIRDDSGVCAGYEVPIYYDALLSKLVAHGDTRAAAISRMRRALLEYRVLGVRTTLPFLVRALRHPSFISGSFDTSFVERLTEEPPRDELIEVAVVAAALQAYREREDAAGKLGTQGERRSLWWQTGVREAQGRP